MSDPSSTPRIAVFDSGLGALSVAMALRRRIPRASIDVVGDSANAPYGERDQAWIVARCAQVADDLRRTDYAVWVIACNTATAAAIDALRSKFPHQPIVGLEPGIKPAATTTRTGVIAVLATESTLQSRRFAELVERHARNLSVIPIACPGLAAAIEQGDRSSIVALVQRYCAPLRSTQCDTVVLGCTHYPLIRPEIAGYLGQAIHIIEPSDAVALRTSALLPGHVPGAVLPYRSNAALEPAGLLNIRTTGDCILVGDIAQRWLGTSIPVTPWHLPLPLSAPSVGDQEPATE